MTWFCWRQRVLMVLFAAVSGIGTAIGVGMLPQLDGLQRLTVWNHHKCITISTQGEEQVIVSLWLAGSAMSDVIIASALTWHLVSVIFGLL